MRLRSKGYIWLFFSILIAIMIVTFLLNTAAELPAKPKILSSQRNDNYPRASYVTVRDEAGDIILQTGTPISVDDEFISEKNTRYVISSIQGAEALARVKTDSNTQPPAALPSARKTSAVPAVAINQPRHVVLYTTHTDESYVPVSGTASQPGAGDVYSVAATLGAALQKSGVSVSQSLNAHDPHDINAYSRSRRTMVQLLKQQPDAAFDIHRDSAPGEAYVTRVNGLEVGRVMIVVGRANPNLNTNLDFAMEIKQACDTLYPGLMRGIFIGRGDYNQDLYPTALIFEMGSQDTPLDDVYKSANCLADVVITVLNTR